MPEISLTDFVDFALKVGGPKQTKVREIKNRGDYDPITDFWRPLRECIRQFHATPGGDRRMFDNLLAQLTDPKKKNRYPIAISGYKKFLGRKQINALVPIGGLWSFGGLEVRVNPELNLEISGQSYVTKLYFKDEAPTAHRLQHVLELMRITLNGTASAGSKMAVLDVSNSKLVTPLANAQDLTALLQGEALNFVQIWNNV